MAKIIGRPTVQLTIALELTEEEAGLLCAIAGYGWQDFQKVFKERLGKHYLEQYERVGPALFHTLYQDLDGYIKQAQRSRAEFCKPSASEGE